MAKTRFTVNLGNLKLSQKEYKKIMDAVHKTVNNELKTVTSPKAKKATTKSLTDAGTTTVATATIKATFTGTEPGLSELKAKHKSVVQTLTQSGTLIFKNVSKNDTIRIQGKSLGTSDISIDLTASPQQKKFEPGTFNFNFIIL
jgi:hypothetical protein